MAGPCNRIGKPYIILAAGTRLSGELLQRFANDARRVSVAGMSVSNRGPRRGIAHVDAELVELVDGTTRLVEAVSRADRLAQRHFGLSGAQLFVLRLLAESPAQSVNDLAARTGTHQSTVSVVVGRLVARGLVSRRVSEDDARRVTLALTRTGRDLARRAPESAHSPLAEALLRLPRRERRALAQSLARLVDELWTEDLGGGGLDPLRPRIARRDRRRR